MITFLTVSLPISTVSPGETKVAVVVGVADIAVVALTTTVLEPLTVEAVAAFVVMSMGKRMRLITTLRSESVTCNPTCPPWRAQVRSFDELHRPRGAEDGNH